MHSASPSDIRGSTLRLAVAAVIVGLAIPLLPLFGDQSPEFIFSHRLSWRLLIPFSLVWWTSALVAVVGIWFLKRDRAGPAGGVFLAVGFVVAIGIAGNGLARASLRSMAVRRALLALETAEAILLILAGMRAFEITRETGESPPPESRS
jgi:hypothetical protein